MFLSSWRKLVQQVRRSNGMLRNSQRQQSDARKSRWLFVEPLEDRTLLSTFQWTGTAGDGIWSTPNNWSPNTGFPNAVADIAQFTLPYGGPQTMELDRAITVGEIDFGSSADITIGSSTSKVLTLNNTGATSGKAMVSLTAANSGTDLISAPISVVAATPLAANIAGGTLNLSNTSATANVIGAGSLFTVQKGGANPAKLSVTGPNVTGLADVDVNSGGTLTVDGSGKIGHDVGTGVNLTVSAGGLIAVGDKNVANANRLGHASILLLNGGIFKYQGTDNSLSTETLGDVLVEDGSSTFTTISGDGG